MTEDCNCVVSVNLSYISFGAFSWKLECPLEFEVDIPLYTYILIVGVNRRKFNRTSNFVLRKSRASRTLGLENTFKSNFDIVLIKALGCKSVTRTFGDWPWLLWHLYRQSCTLPEVGSRRHKTMLHQSRHYTLPKNKSLPYLQPRNVGAEGRVKQTQARIENHKKLTRVTLYIALYCQPAGDDTVLVGASGFNLANSVKEDETS